MDWRTRLRKIVNREDHLGPVRLGLLRMIDPIEWYMRKSEEERGWPRPQRRRGGPIGWTTYTNLEREPSAAGAEVLKIDETRPRRPAGDPDEDIDEYLRRRDSLRKQHFAYFEEKAKDLLAGKDAVIESTEGTVRARLVPFRNGAVFERWHTSGHTTGHGLTRIERQYLSDPTAELMSYLVDATLDLE